MHELGLMTGVMDAAVEAAREAGATRLLGVRVSIGEATEAVEDALVFAFEALAEADPFTQGATLGLTMIRPRSVCLECGHEFEHDLYNRFCPVCDSFATELLAGRELQIDSIEVDLPGGVTAAHVARRTHAGNRPETKRCHTRGSAFAMLSQFQPERSEGSPLAPTREDAYEPPSDVRGLH